MAVVEYLENVGIEWTLCPYNIYVWAPSRTLRFMLGDMFLQHKHKDGQLKRVSGISMQ